MSENVKQINIYDLSIYPNKNKGLKEKKKEFNVVYINIK
jgi:hypothetical protein